MTAATLPRPRVTRREAVIAALCRKSFSDFVRLFWGQVPGAGTLVWNWHLGLLADEMQEAALRVQAGIARPYDLVFNVPFGTSKSSVLSILFPAWVWTFYPQARFLTATHTDKLVRDLSAKSRAVLVSELYRDCFPGLVLVKDSEDYFRNNHGGDRNCCTVGGKTPTGFHSDFTLIDDALDPQGARSETELETAAHFVREVIPSRKTNKAVSLTVLIMQRLHYRDPTAVMEEVGRLEGAVPVRKICLPGELTDRLAPHLDWLRERHGPAVYAEDGLLDPLRLSRSVLRSYRAALGQYGYSSQVLQDPQPPGGSMFRPQWFAQRLRAAPYHAKRVRYIDRAACLIAGTMIETADGPRPIELVREGDWVLTRKGYRQVEWAGVSGFVDELASVLFDNGSVVTGTLDHPVWDDGKGYWVDLATLDGGCYNTCLVPDRRHVCLTSGRENGNRKSGQSACGLMGGHTIAGLAADISGVEGSRCTGRFGNTVTATSPVATKYITRTGIGTTTQLKIWNASRLASTIRSTGCFGDGTAPWLPNFITGNLRGLGSKPRSTGRTVAFSADRSSGLGTLTNPGFCIAVQNVGDGTNQERMKRLAVNVAKGIGVAQVHTHAQVNVRLSTSPGFASCAARSSMAGRNDNTFAVAGSVAKPRGVPVYDLQVNGEHEFFANGILVHNTANGGCATAMVLLARDDQGRLYVEHVERGQWEPNERNDRIVATALRDRDRYGPRHAPTVVIEAERGSTGLESFQNIARRVLALGVRCREDQPSGSKDTRAEPWADQLAALNVWLVEDGTWDVGGFVQEHLLFRPEPGKRLGGFKDQVDAAAGACGQLLGKQRSVEGARVIPLKKTSHGLRLIVCDEETLPSLHVTQRAVLVRFRDPDPYNASNGEELVGCGAAGDPPPGSSPLPHEPPTGPRHGLEQLLDKVVLVCMDLAPAEVQDTWDDLVPSTGRPPRELIMTKAQGKTLWSCLRRKRPQPPELYVFVDQGDRRALSAALAVTDALRLERSVIYLPAFPELTLTAATKPENEHVYAVVKDSRSMVIT